MLTQLSRLGPFLALVLTTACVFDDDTELDEETLSEHESALANLEYQVTDTPCPDWRLGDMQPVDCDLDGLSAECGRAWYHVNNEDFCVRDNKADGRRVGVHWRLTDGSRRGLCVVKTGNDTEGVCYKNFPNEKKISFRIGRCDAGEQPCDDPGSGWTNWSDWKTIPVQRW
jgi:hypothetical protein